MKTTKHIIKLAKKFAELSLKEHLNLYRKHIKHAYEKENTNEAKKRYYNESVKHYSIQLNRIKNALLKGKFYCGVESVSKSGMTRKVKLAYIFKNKLWFINDYQILALACVNKNNKISGCGMDMLFHAQYSLFHALHANRKQANYQKRLTNYHTL